MEIAQKAPETVILAEDEATLYLQATTMRVWAPRGQTPVVRVHTGREKTHFYGSLNLQSGEEYIMRSEKMNSEATAKYLEQLAQQIPEKPVLLLWDRAPWHGGDAIRQFCERHPRFDFLKLPPGAPDLNPQEHVWKAGRTHVSHNHNRPKLPELANEFENYLKENRFPTSMLTTYGYDAVRVMFE